MSNQYYNFLSQRLINWLNENSDINIGDKFFILLDGEGETKSLYSSLLNQKISKLNTFYSSEFNYKTISYQSGKNKILFVASIDDITNDFLVTVRNRVNENKNEWENTSVVFIVDNALDSIISGSFDMGQKDAPFDILTLKKDVLDILEQKDGLSIANKITVKKYLEIISENTNSVIKDFETVFSIVEKNTIDDSDYIEMGYFPDSAINSFSDEKTIEQRLEENRESFQKIETYHSLSNGSDKIDEYVGKKSLSNRLKEEEEWKSVDFSEISNARDSLRKSNKIKLSFDTESIMEDDNSLWYALDGQTSLKRRKMNIILSSFDSDNNFSFEIPFDDKISKKGITNSLAYEFFGNKIDINCNVRGNKLNVSIQNINKSATIGGIIEYRHKGIKNLKFEIKFIIFPFNLNLIANVRAGFSIDVIKSKKQYYFIASQNLPELIFGDEPFKKISVKNISELKGTDLVGTKLDLSNLTQSDDKEYYRVNCQIQDYFFPLSFADYSDKPIPKTAVNIEKIRLEQKDAEITFFDDKVAIGSNIFYIQESLKNTLHYERDLIEQNMLLGFISGKNYHFESLDLPDEIIMVYHKLFDYYKSNNTLPSIAINKHEYIQILSEVVSCVKFCLEKNLLQDKTIPKKISNISKIGMLIGDNKIYLTPINPFLIMYQLELYFKIKDYGNIANENILNTLNPQNLIPYLKYNDETYGANYSVEYPRWLTFNKLEERKLSVLGTKIISKRLNDYVLQYKFLFDKNPYIPINIAAISIVDEVGFFKSVITFMFERIRYLEKRSKDIFSINSINIYFDKLGTQINSLFNRLFEMKRLDDIFALCDLKLFKFEHEDYEILEVLKEKINVFKIPDTKKITDLNIYFHITFYQFVQQKSINESNMTILPINHTLSGLISGNRFKKDGNYYRTGFGIGNKNSDFSELISFACLWNSFIYTASKETNTYKKGYVLSNNISELNNSELKKYLDCSSWLTMLNLDVDLAYFFDDSKSLIIHYTDQNIANQYESITVTKDFEQYDRLIKNVFQNKKYNMDIYEIIKNFNIINGQWLLEMLSNNISGNNKLYFTQEKISIVSAYKELIGILEKENIMWIPISLEEILRVSGMIGLKQSEGIFSAKNLGEEGQISDDLLMIGIENQNQNIILHYLPVEVKFGKNGSNVLEKAINQVKNTSNVLNKYVLSDENRSFMRDYYRTFFVSLILSNLNKLRSSKLFSSKYNNDDLLDLIESRLMLEEYSISNRLMELYGEGIVFEFTTDATSRRGYYLDNHNITIIEVPEADAYEQLNRKTEEIVDKIQSGLFDFPNEILLHNIYSGEDSDSTSNVNSIKFDNDDYELMFNQTSAIENPNDNSEDNYSEEINSVKNQFISDDIVNEENIKISKIDSDTELISTIETDSKEDYHNNEVLDAANDKIWNNVDFKQSDNNVFEERLEDIRFLIGKVQFSNKNIYWEYGNKRLANRHMLVTGKSGQGKTYFIQRILSQFIDNSINSLIIDYTNGFLPNQLDPLFSEKYNDNIKHRIVYKEKLPINPFKLQMIDFGGIVEEENVEDMVDRVVQILDFVFDLGIQQRALLNDIIVEGYRINGEKYTFSYLERSLKESENKAAQTLYGRLQPLLTRDPFMYDSDFNWSEIFNNNGEVHIFQLAPFQKNIQQAMVEFTLWDLYQYATRTGSERKPLPIILDEVQNLSFSHNSPTSKILREGRKFGISGIFATQDIEAIKGDDSTSIFNVAEQVHFLPPDSQIQSIAKWISIDNDSKKKNESLLKKLHKGEALIYGPVSANGSLTEARINVVSISSFN